MSRGYYAVFHTASALLLLEGVEPKTHAGVLRVLHGGIAVLIRMRK